MKKSFFIIIYFSLFIVLFANEIFIQEEGRIYKVTLSENGDTLSKEEIQIIPLDTIAIQQIKEKQTEIKPEITAVIDTPLYNPQLLRIIPLKWQIGLSGAWQGLGYGPAITYGLEIWDEKYSPVISASVPILMFFLPPILIKDEVPEAAYPIVDWGYRLGPVDYISLRTSLTNRELNEQDVLYAALTGYTESWGGYTLIRKTGTYRRAAADFYGAGSYLGYLWGGLIGFYFCIEYPDVKNIDNIAIGMAFTFSVGMRSLGFYLGNREDLKLKSFDSYIYAFNTIPGLLLATDIYSTFFSGEDWKTFPLTSAVLSMGTTALSAYILKDIHLDDGNAILMIIGGLFTGFLGQSIEQVIASYTGGYEKIHTSIGALCMIAGEVGVYYLRKDAIKSGSDFGSNLGFNLYPTNNNGMGVNLSYSF